MRRWRGQLRQTEVFGRYRKPSVVARTLEAPHLILQVRPREAMALINEFLDSDCDARRSEL